MKYDIVIIGAGIVGLATALKIIESKPGLKLAVIDKEDGVARHQTGHNSGVIHSGIYYRPGSLRAVNCRKGYDMLVDFCRNEGIAHDICGKIIVATRQDELPAMENIFKRGIQNGLDKIRKISAEEIKEFEPFSTGIAGIHVPYAGIINFGDVAVKIADILKDRFGVDLIFNARVTDIRKKNGSAEIIAGDNAFIIKLGINTAGLHSDEIAALNMDRVDVRIIPFRGEYYEISKEREYLVKNLIYPVPDPNFPFLGVHFTRMINGGIEAGPNAVFSLRKEGYKKGEFSLRDASRSLGWTGFLKIMMKFWKKGLGEIYRSYNKNAFTRQLQRLVPEITITDLTPGLSGVRAMACDRQGNLIDDFIFAENDHMINVLNAPSPAATAAFAIGETVAEKVLKRF